MLLNVELTDDRTIKSNSKEVSRQEQIPKYVKVFNIYRMLENSNVSDKIKDLFGFYRLLQYSIDSDRNAVHKQTDDFKRPRK